MRTLILGLALLALGGLTAQAEDLGAAKRGINAPSMDGHDLISYSTLFAGDKYEPLTLNIHDLKLSHYLGNNVLLPEESSDWVNAIAKSASSTVIWGAFLPFVAIPDGHDDPEDPGLFSESSISFFWYLKTKF